MKHLNEYLQKSVSPEGPRNSHSHLTQEENKQSS